MGRFGVVRAVSGSFDYVTRGEAASPSAQDDDDCSG
jgi:hypothetical protein